MHKRGGGVALLFNDFLQCNNSCLEILLFFFEYVALLLKSSSQVILIGVYRQPQHCAGFFNDLTELLSMTCMDFDCITTVGDLTSMLTTPKIKGLHNCDMSLTILGWLSMWQSPHKIRGALWTLSSLGVWTFQRLLEPILLCLITPVFSLRAPSQFTQLFRKKWFLNDVLLKIQVKNLIRFSLQHLSCPGSQSMRRF